MTSDQKIERCLANIVIAIRHHGFPDLTPITTQCDRVVFAHNKAFIDQINVSPAFSSWAFNSNHGTTAIRGWREEVALCSMQVIEHTAAIEIDFDLYNPNYGIGPALLHGFLEVWWPGKTDPQHVTKGLIKRGIIAA